MAIYEFVRKGAFGHLKKSGELRWIQILLLTNIFDFLIKLAVLVTEGLEF